MKIHEDRRDIRDIKNIRDIRDLQDILDIQDRSDRRDMKKNEEKFKKSRIEIFALPTHIHTYQGTHPLIEMRGRTKIDTAENDIVMTRIICHGTSNSKLVQTKS